MSRKIRTICAACKRGIAQEDLVIESDSRGVPKHTYHRWCVFLQSEDQGKTLAIAQKKKLNLKNIFKKEEVKNVGNEEESRESVPVEAPIAQ